MRENRLKQRLRDGQTQIGTWVHTLATPPLAQVLATAGFDFVYIDMEHSAFSLQTVTDFCRSGLDIGLPVLVRPAGHAAHLISRPVENGAFGVLMPHVDTAADARLAVEAVKFPPLGKRGSQPPNVHTAYARVNTADYMAASNEQTMIMVQIESPQALANLDEILDTEGVDGAVVGRGDLSAELGVPGQRDHPDVLAAVDTLIAACRKRQKFPGLLVQDVAEAREWVSRGIQVVAYASEVMMLRDAGAAALAAIRADQ
jgi:2-keto-3-deoxy-L-rhamnonate aldolase RhmA